MSNSPNNNNNRKRKGNVASTADASPTKERVSTRHASKSSQESPARPSQDSKKRKKRESSASSSNPTRASPRRSSRNIDSCTTDNMAVSRERCYKTPPKTRVSRKVERAPVFETSKGLKGYTSDGMSFESVPDDDLPDINIASPYKGKQYSKDDIVWAPLVTKHYNMLWPAVVTSVKGPNVCFLFIDAYDKPVRRTHAKRLIPFDNSSKNLELKELGDKTPGFKEAYELVIRYYCNKKQNTTLDARRFLTRPYDENDKVGMAKSFLFKLTGKCDGQTKNSEEIEDFEDMEIVDNEDIDDEMEENGEEPKVVSPQSERIREILEDLETLPSHMTVSAEKHEKMRTEAEKLLPFLQSKDCFEYLKKIREGTLKSSRHIRYMKGEKVQGGLGPFTLFTDLTEQFLSALDSHCDDYDSYDYKHNVMLPEALLYAISKYKDCSKFDAKKYYNKTCQKVGIRD
ncbi:uncharacterized protein LOC113203331 [Frankliniella occidentalis]|uniref:Uncharacterized protein LOC113203331 n=1 Tax=Frankliniella occidentalis TaxID=133901 RepID=A0A6J1S4Q7_FRAOC|nr:uncharacterized protein LOC113203331 [Frankliniella occidentalis]